MITLLCPRCGSDNIRLGNVVIGEKDFYCNNCGENIPLYRVLWSISTEEDKDAKSSLGQSEG